MENVEYAIKYHYNLHGLFMSQVILVRKVKFVLRLFKKLEKQ